MRPKTPFKKSNLPVQNEPAPIWGVFHINIRPRTPSGAFFHISCKNKYFVI